MTRRAKKRLLVFLDIIIVMGVIASVIIGIIVANKVQSGSKTNHQDTVNTIQQLKQSNDLNNRIIICMLQVPIAQRTPDLEANCRKVIVTQQTSSNDDNSLPTPMPTAISSPQSSTAAPNPLPANNTSPVVSQQPTPPVVTPTPAPQPSLPQQVGNVLSGIIGFVNPFN